jgi:acyl-CoA reductase-like NAD-dependent aldehyde dehydrogenase
MSQERDVVQKYKMYIGGKWVDAEDGSTLDVINPYKGTVWAKVPDAGSRDVEKAVNAAHIAFETSAWSEILPIQRVQLLNKFADAIESNAERIAVADAKSNGKLIREMLGQMKSIPNWYRYFAGAADKIYGELIPLEKPNTLNYTIHEPLGVVAIIVPWNSPILIISYSMAPALAAGNTIVLKPSKYAPVGTLELMKAVEEAGFPQGVVNVITGSGGRAGESLVAHPLVKKVVFTGGTEMGKHIAKSAAQNLTGVTLELGGKSPNIVFEDADLESAVNGVLAGIFAACGQTCVAGSRAFVQDTILNEFKTNLISRTSRIKIGDPLDPETEYGPIANQEQFDKIVEWVDIAVKEGAELVCGGTKHTSPNLKGGLFFQPTIFMATNDMRIAQEEVFGPVLCIIPFSEESEVVKLANESHFGLAAGIWTNDLRRAHHVARRLQAGTVWVNTYRSISFASPFGGYKGSGYGRENSLEAIREFTQTKSVWIDLTGKMGDPFVLR